MSDNFYLVKNLPYSMVDLEPIIDKTTLCIHHDKIYVKYVEKLNYLILKSKQLSRYSIEELLFNPYLIPANIMNEFLYNAGGVYNHELYFENLSKNKSLLNGPINDLIIKQYKKVDNFYEKILSTATSPINYNWVVLGLTKNNDLTIIGLKDNDTSVSLNIYPLIVIDIAEHSYFMKYHNHKEHYIKNVLQIIDYDVVNSRLNKMNKSVF